MRKKFDRYYGIGLFPAALSKALSFLMMLMTVLAFSSLPASASYGELGLRSRSNTYVSASAFTTPAVSTTDMFLITFGGSISSAEILEIDVAYTGSGIPAAENPIFLLKRSADDTAGTSTTETIIPVNSGSPSAGCVVRTYTANPSSLGALVGTSGRVAAGILTALVDGYDHNGGAPCPPYKVLYMAPPGTGQGLTLVSSGQTYAINFNGTAPSAAGAKLAFRIVWREWL